MKQKFEIPQEGLKFIACLTMLIDHIGAVFFPTVAWFRIIGRISFPLYCFLLAEGIHHTRNPRKYFLRLLFIAMITEIPYDLLFSGQLTWAKNSVMVTLLLGFAMGISMEKLPMWAKSLPVIPFAYISRYFHGTYGMEGLLMIAIFLLPRALPFRMLIQSVLMVLLSLRMAGFPGNISIQFYAILALIPIRLYSGKKCSHSSILQWVFTLFYPLHIVILLLIRGI